MDSTELLAREEEFKKLNKQLEKKTVSLMKEIENAMNKKDIFAEFPQTLTSMPHRQKLQHSCSDTSKTNSPVATPIKTKKNNHKLQKKCSPNSKCIDKKSTEKMEEKQEDSEFENGIQNGCRSCNCCVVDKPKYGLEFLYAFVTLNVQMKVLPPSFLRDNPNVESVCKFLASKVGLMQEQIDKLQGTIDAKVAQCDGHMAQLANYEGERLKLLNKSNNLIAEKTDAKAKLAALQNKFNIKDSLFKEQRNELDKLTAESKILRTKQIAAEAKCITQEEEIERLKHQIEQLKIAEKDFRASSRNLSASHTTAISRLEAKVKTLSRTIDKQKELIDNLREQNSILSVDVALKGHEKSFTEFLIKQ